MLVLVVALVLVWLGIAVVGTVVSGLFWLTLVAIAAILGTGAVGVSLHAARPVPERRPAVRHAKVRSITSAPGHPRGRSPQDDGELRRAA